MSGSHSVSTSPTTTLAADEESPSDGPEKPNIQHSHERSPNHTNPAPQRAPEPHRAGTGKSDSSERTLTPTTAKMNKPPSVFSKAESGHKVKGDGVFKRMFRSSAPNTPVAESGHKHPTNGAGPSYFDDKADEPATPDFDDRTGTFSPPSSRPPSRAPSFKSNKGTASRKSSFSKDTAPPSVATASNGTSHKPASIAGSEHGGGQRFTLKELLASGPKLARKTSASSRKSDASSEHGGGGAGSTTSLLQKYGVCERVAIGKGATSVVRLAHKWDRSEEKLYAVKEFRKRRSDETEKEYVKKLTSEFCISSTLHHVNIVETVDLVQDENKHWCEVMEYCPGGDLYAAIKKGGMSPSEIECCFKQILVGISYLHAQGVAHRDIKPENLFFDTHGHVKIGDYGASTVYRLPWEGTVHMSTGLCGSEPYIAPEQFLHKPYDARLVDIWATAIVYYCLIFQELPWRVARPSDNLFTAYVTQCIAMPYPGSAALTPTPSTSSANSASPRKEQWPQTISNISPRGARPLLRRMLEPNPKLRCTIEEIIAHPWLQSIEVCTDVVKPSHIHGNVKAALGQTVQTVSHE